MSLTQFLQSTFSVYFLYPNLAMLTLAYLYSRWKRSMTTFWVALVIVCIGFVIGSFLVALQLSGMLPGW